MTLLDAARVGCAMDGVAIDIHRGYAGGVEKWLKLNRENRPLEPKVLKLLIRALIAMSPWLFLNETGCYAIHGGPSFVLSMALGTLSASSTVAPALGTSLTVPATLVQFLLFHRVFPLLTLLLFKICSFYPQHTAFLIAFPEIHD